MYPQHGGKISHDIANLMEGIGRKKVQDKYQYFYFKNNKPVSKKDLKRIQKLVIPPAWTDVWIAVDPKASIQAIGTDKKGLKQYRYSQAHIEKAEQEKFIRLYNFIKSLPKLERAMKNHTTHPLYSKERTMITMLKIIKLVHMRVGKECYAKTNRSYGISSLKKKHLKISPDKAVFNFKGKAGKRLNYTIKDKEIIKELKMLLKLEGDKLFQYIHPETSKFYRVTDQDLNQFIQDKMGKEFTCKDFRTYAANHYFIKTLQKLTTRDTSQKRIKKNILNALKKTAHHLKHTRAISKKSYVMRFVVNMYESDPQFFVEHREEPADKFLLALLKIYRTKVLKK